MRPDLLLQWCVFADYPLYRAWMRKYREKFNKIIIYPSRHHGVVDLEAFAKKVVPETWIRGHVIDWTTPGIDWRQAETEPMLDQVESDWIYFSEQDFFCKNWDKFFSDIEKESKEADIMGLWNPTHFPYIHPSCLLIKTELLNKTNKDFRAHPEINGADHFSMITSETYFDGKGRLVSLQNMGYDCDVTPGADAFHLGGLTYVYQNWKGDGTDHYGVQSIPAFMTYNWEMSKADVPQSEEFMRLSQAVHVALTKKYPHFNPDNNEWTKFFSL